MRDMVVALLCLALAMHAQAQEFGLTNNAWSIVVRDGSGQEWSVETNSKCLDHNSQWFVNCQRSVPKLVGISPTESKRIIETVGPQSYNFTNTHATPVPNTLELYCSPCGPYPTSNPLDGYFNCVETRWTLSCPVGSLCSINGSAVIVDDVVVVITTPNVVVTVDGILVLNLTPETSITVGGCVSGTTGTLILEIDPSILSQLLNNGQPFLTYGSGCSEPALMIQSNLDPCVDGTVTVENRNNGLFLLLLGPATEGCDQNLGANPALIGGVVGGVVGAVVIALAIVMLIPAARTKVFPFMNRKEETRVASTNPNVN